MAERKQRQKKVGRPLFYKLIVEAIKAFSKPENEFDLMPRLMVEIERFSFAYQAYAKQPRTAQGDQRFLLQMLGLVTFLLFLVGAKENKAYLYHQSTTKRRVKLFGIIPLWNKTVYEYQSRQDPRLLIDVLMHIVMKQFSLLPVFPKHQLILDVNNIVTDEINRFNAHQRHQLLEDAKSIQPDEKLVFRDLEYPDYLKLKLGDVVEDFFNESNQQKRMVAVKSCVSNACEEKISWMIDLLHDSIEADQHPISRFPQVFEQQLLSNQRLELLRFLSAYRESKFRHYFQSLLHQEFSADVILTSNDANTVIQLLNALSERYSADYPQPIPLNILKIWTVILIDFLTKVVTDELPLCSVDLLTCISGFVISHIKPDNVLLPGFTDWNINQRDELFPKSQRLKRLIAAVRRKIDGVSATASEVAREVEEAQEHKANLERVLVVEARQLTEAAVLDIFASYQGKGALKAADLQTVAQALHNKVGIQYAGFFLDQWLALVERWFTVNLEFTVRDIDRLVITAGQNDDTEAQLLDNIDRIIQQFLDQKERVKTAGFLLDPENKRVGKILKPLLEPGFKRLQTGLEEAKRQITEIFADRVMPVIPVSAHLDVESAFLGAIASITDSSTAKDWMDQAILFVERQLTLFEGVYARMIGPIRDGEITDMTMINCVESVDYAKDQCLTIIDHVFQSAISIQEKIGTADLPRLEETIPTHNSDIFTDKYAEIRTLFDSREQVSNEMLTIQQNTLAAMTRGIQASELVSLHTSAVEKFEACGDQLPYCITLRANYIDQLNVAFEHHLELLIVAIFHAYDRSGLVNADELTGAATSIAKHFPDHTAPDSVVDKWLAMAKQHMLLCVSAVATSCAGLIELIESGEDVLQEMMLARVDRLQQDAIENNNASKAAADFINPDDNSRLILRNNAMLDQQMEDVTEYCEEARRRIIALYSEREAVESRMQQAVLQIHEAFTDPDNDDELLLARKKELLRVLPLQPKESDTEKPVYKRMCEHYAAKVEAAYKDAMVQRGGMAHVFGEYVEGATGSELVTSSLDYVLIWAGKINALATQGNLALDLVLSRFSQLAVGRIEHFSWHINARLTDLGNVLSDSNTISNENVASNLSSLRKEAQQFIDSFKLILSVLDEFKMHLVAVSTHLDEFAALKETLFTETASAIQKCNENRDAFHAAADRIVTLAELEVDRLVAPKEATREWALACQSRLIGQLEDSINSVATRYAQYERNRYVEIIEEIFQPYISRPPMNLLWRQVLLDVNDLPMSRFIDFPADDGQVPIAKDADDTCTEAGVCPLNFLREDGSIIWDAVSIKVMLHIVEVLSASATSVSDVESDDKELIPFTADTYHALKMFVARVIHLELVKVDDMFLNAYAGKELDELFDIFEQKKMHFAYIDTSINEVIAKLAELSTDSEGLVDVQDLYEKLTNAQQGIINNFHLLVKKKLSRIIIDTVTDVSNVMKELTDAEAISSSYKKSMAKISELVTSYSFTLDTLPGSALSALSDMQRQHNSLLTALHQQTQAMGEAEIPENDTLWQSVMLQLREVCDPQAGGSLNLVNDHSGFIDYRYMPLTVLVKALEAIQPVDGDVQYTEKTDAMVKPMVLKCIAAEKHRIFDASFVKLDRKSSSDIRMQQEVCASYTAAMTETLGRVVSLYTSLAHTDTEVRVACDTFRAEMDNVAEALRVGLLRQLQVEVKAAVDSVVFMLIKAGFTSLESDAELKRSVCSAFGNELAQLAQLAQLDDLYVSLLPAGMGASVSNAETGQNKWFELAKSLIASRLGELVADTASSHSIPDEGDDFVIAEQSRALDSGT